MVEAVEAVGREHGEDGSIEYVREGSGTPLVMLCGWLRTRRDFDGVWGKFTAMHDCIAIEPTRWGISKSTAGIVELMDKLDIEKTGVVGDSLGTLVALELAANYPKRVSYLVLQGTPNFPEPLKHYVWTRDETFDLKDLMEDPGMEAIFRMFDANKSGISVMRFLRRYSKIAMDTLREMISLDCFSTASGILAPTLILEGERTSEVISSWRQLVAAMKNAEVRIIPDAGHMAIIQQPGKFAEETLKFISKMEGAVGS